MRLLADYLAADSGKVRLIAGEKTSEPISIPTNALGGGVVVPDRRFELAPAEGGEGLVTIDLPAKGKAFTVLLSTVEGGFQSVVIPENDRSFKKGDLYLFNNSGETITGLVGGVEVELANGSSVIVEPKAEESKKSYSVSLKVSEESGERVLSSTVWPVEESMRSYVFFYVDPTSERITFRTVDEFVQ